jgi:cysteinyl-tRNA synthetase
MKRKVIELRSGKLKGENKSKDYVSQFVQSINDDLNMPAAMHVIWKVVEDDSFDSKKKLAILEEFDEVLGLDIVNMKESISAIPGEIMQLAKEREAARKAKDWNKSDQLRDVLKDKGYVIEDTSEGYRLTPR